MANVVARCLEREPARRWAAAEELIEALQFRGGLPGAEAPEPATEAVPPIDPRAVVRRFRRNALAWLGVSIMAFALDLVDGSVQFAPLVLILGLFVMAGQYAKAWIAGLEWRDLVGRQDGPMGRWADGQSDLSVMMTAVSTSLRDTPVHRVRNDRAAIVRLLAQVPKAERAQLPELVPVLDRLVALVDDLARQDRAIRMELDRPSASAPGGIRPADANTERLDVIHRQTVAVAGSVGRLRTAVERMRSAGTQSAKPAIEQALEEVVTVERR